MNQQPPIIAFFGYKGSGKTTAASVAEEFGYVRRSFAAPLKAMLRALGLTQEEIDSRELREQPHPLLGGKTPRWAMQSLGTEWGRDCIDGDLWARAWAQSRSKGELTVNDDLRFPNEFKLVKKLGGIVVKIERSGVVQTTNHESERYVDDPDVLKPDFIIQNEAPNAKSFKFAVRGIGERHGLWTREEVLL